MGAKKIINDEPIKFLSLADVAKLTTYNLKSIARFVREGRLKTVKLNGRRLVTRKQYKAFLLSSLEEGDLGQ